MPRLPEVVAALCAVGSIAITIAHAPATPARAPRAHPVALPTVPVTVAEDELEPERVPIERAVALDEYVDRMRALRQACRKAGGKEPHPMAVSQGVFLECWSPGDGNGDGLNDGRQLFSEWVLHGTEVPKTPVPVPPRPTKK